MDQYCDGHSDWDRLVMYSHELGSLMFVLLDLLYCILLPTVLDIYWISWVSNEWMSIHVIFIFFYFLFLNSAVPYHPPMSTYLDCLVYLSRQVHLGFCCITLFVPLELPVVFPPLGLCFLTPVFWILDCFQVPPRGMTTGHPFHSVYDGSVFYPKIHLIMILSK